MDKQIEGIALSPDSFSWLEERTVLFGPTGSHAYGTAIEGSDKDYKGVCIPPVEYFLGLKSFNEYNKAGGKNLKNSKNDNNNDVNDVDVNIIHINKFVRDAMQGVPNNIEMLFLPKDQYLKLTSPGEILIRNRRLFLSRNLKKKFGGYAFSQIQKVNYSPLK